MGFVSPLSCAKALTKSSEMSIFSVTRDPTVTLYKAKPPPSVLDIYEDTEYVLTTPKPITRPFPGFYQRAIEVGPIL